MRFIVKKFEISNFRNFRNIEFVLGNRITVISGQNGVGKSNLLSLISSGSGVTKKSILGSNFQPEFYDFFNIDSQEKFKEYQLFLYYNNENNENVLVKRLSFKDDSSRDRGIRVIPRTTNHGSSQSMSVKETAINIKNKYNVGGAARVPIPTIYLSLSRLYPLGEKKELVSIKKLNKKHKLYQIGIDEKFKKWYNSVIPNTIGERDELSVIKKKTSVRSSLHMDMKNTPALSQSIGQDNIGNIISALIDIFILSKDESYNGALLCIDEIEVSLHPDTQLRLLDLFDSLAQEYKIQFVLSTHSLTILKEILGKEKGDNENYAVIYLKNPSMPQLMEKREYELLKADLFNKITYHRPKPKIYFEDEVGKEVFLILVNTLARLLEKTPLQGLGEISFRNADESNDFGQKYEKRLNDLNSMVNMKNQLDMIVTKLGCEELFKIQLADNYFKRVIFMLDGDARIQNNQYKPKVRDYLNKDFNPSELRLNDRDHSPNICFLPGYFAPESYFYKIIMHVINEGVGSQIFWRNLDHSEDTALYTPDKIRSIFDKLSGEFTNDDVKKCFTKEVWDFIKKSEILVYYYSDYKHIEEFLQFFESLSKAYGMVLPLTLSNRYA